MKKTLHIRKSVCNSPFIYQLMVGDVPVAYAWGNSHYVETDGIESCIWVKDADENIIASFETSEIIDHTV